MNKKIIVLASVLKPVNDSRNYEKTAISISKFGKYKVHVVGQKVLNTPMGSSILFNPLFSFKRLSITRFFTGWIFLRYLIRIKPDLVIITTFELLVPAIIYRMIYSKKLFYDVQENYFRNIFYTNSFPPIIKHVLAILVRSLEWLTRPFIHHYILAEKNYEREFSFSKNKSIILENKVLKRSTAFVRKKEPGVIQLLYSGTISENYGIFEAVELAKLLHEKNNKIRLSIIGFSSKKETLDRLTNVISTLDFVTLEGGDQIVPHAGIVEAILTADFGLISYRPNKSTENCIPTKLYEYLAYQLPYLVAPNPIWNEVTAYYSSGIAVDFTKPAIDFVMNEMNNKQFFTLIPGDEIYWNEDQLGDLLNRFL